MADAAVSSASVPAPDAPEKKRDKKEKDGEKKKKKKDKDKEKEGQLLHPNLKPCRWNWDTNRMEGDEWIVGDKAFLKRSNDGEIRYVFGNTVFEDGVFGWGLKVGNASFLYIGHIDADKFRGWQDTWLHAANHCHCVSYAGGVFYSNGKRMGTAKRIRDGCTVWSVVDTENRTITLTKGKDPTKVLCVFQNTPKRVIPFVGIGCSNISYELKF